MAMPPTRPTTPGAMPLPTPQQRTTQRAPVAGQKPAAAAAVVRPTPRTPAPAQGVGTTTGGSKAGAPVRPTPTTAVAVRKPTPAVGQPKGAPTGPVGVPGTPPPQMLAKGGVVKGKAKPRLGQGVDTVRVGGTPTFAKGKPTATSAGTKPRPPSRGKAS